MTWWDEHKRRRAARGGGGDPPAGRELFRDELEIDSAERLDESHAEQFDEDEQFDAELAAIDAELAAEQAQGDAEQGMGNLDEWSQRVDDFGGRAASPVRADARKQLSQGQLGQTAVLQTSLPLGAVFPAAILLAEVSLNDAIAMDVTFSYQNRLAPPGTPLAAFLDPGDGFVRITWGAPGTFQHEVAIDGGHGWRKEFTASYLRVEYVPVDPTGAQPLLSGQARDLGVGATITPAAGGTSPRLTKTTTLENLLTPASTTGRVPAFAMDYVVTGFFVEDDGEWNIFFATGGDPAAVTYAVNGAQSDWPIWQASSHVRRLPQRSGSFFLRTLGAVGTADIANPAVVFGLAL